MRLSRIEFRRAKDNFKHGIESTVGSVLKRLDFTKLTTNFVFYLQINFQLIHEHSRKDFRTLI